MTYTNDLVKQHLEGECLDIGSGSEDSDCESDSGQVGEHTPEERVNGKKELERESLPVLTIGSFVSWRSLFFYLCTGTIQFAPLKSQSSDARARYVREQTTPERPPPCSPKAIYSLAAALDVKPLRDLAFDDIRSKVTSANVVTELFSRFTSRENEVMKVHCELLSDKCREKSTTASMVDLIKGMVGGKAAHRAGALKLTLRNGRPRGGVFLRCPDSDCDFHHNPTSVRPSLRCPRRHASRMISPYLECANCLQVRSNHYIECQGCGQRFR